MLNSSLPYLSLSSSEQRIKQAFEAHLARELPFVDADNAFIGFLSYDSFLGKNPKTSVQDLLSCADAVVEAQAHVHEVMRVSLQHEMSAVAVVGKKRSYVGTLTLEDMLYAFSTLLALSHAGATMKILARQQDYNLQELAAIVENNGGKILSLYLTPDPKDSHHLFVHLKLNTSDHVARIVSGLERRKYQVVVDTPREDSTRVRRNLDMLMKYLNI